MRLKLENYLRLDLKTFEMLIFLTDVTQFYIYFLKYCKYIFP